MGKIIDSRDLIKEKVDLQEQILENFNEKFNKEVTDYYDIDSSVEESEKGSYGDFIVFWKDEYDKIEEIDDLEKEIGNEFYFGVTLINEDYFEDFVKQDLENCGYIPKDFPIWIEIDWKATARNVGQDYSEIEYQGNIYYYRA